jgi:hypothetical protein
MQILSGKKESFRCYVGFKGLIFIQDVATSNFYEYKIYENNFILISGFIYTVTEKYQAYIPAESFQPPRASRTVFPFVFREVTFL